MQTTPRRPRPAAPSLMPVDQSTRAALVRRTHAHATVEVYAGRGPQHLVGSAIATSLYVRVPLNRRLVPGEHVSARQKVSGLWSARSRRMLVEHNYVTHHYDMGRTGWNPFETTLNRANASHLQLLFSRDVDDAIRAQPLYAQNVAIPRKGRHNIVIAATEGDSIYAFDADSTAASAPPLWHRNLIDAGKGESAVQPADVNGCDSQLGVTATPVIDRTTNTLYVSCILKKQTVLFHLHAIDLATGVDHPGSPVEISDATVSYTNQSGGVVKFNPITQGNRPGLLLNGGVVYVAFGSHCFDAGEYHGWIVAFEADVPESATFLTQLGVFNTTADDINPQNDAAGIWQSGMGLAGDDDGHVYFLTGNGQFNAPVAGTGESYGNTVLKLGLPSSGAQMTVVDYFTPYDWMSKYTIGAPDGDLGSGGPVLLPHQSGQNLMLAAGKVGKAYLIDRDNMGKNVANPVATTDPHYSDLMFDPVPYPDQVPQFVRLPGSATAPGGVAGGPAYYEGPQGGVVYFGSNWQTIKGYRMVNGRLQEPFAMQTPDAVPATSPIPAVSSHGSRNGKGVVWAMIHPDQPLPGIYKLRLHAYAAEDLSDRRFAAEAGDWEYRPEHFGGNSFQVPTVINGRVYTGSRRQLLVWGLPPHHDGDSGDEDDRDRGGNHGD